MTFTALFLLCTAAPADEMAEAKAALEKAGVRILLGGAVLSQEADLAKELSKSTQLRRVLNQAQKELQVAEQQLASVRKALTQLKLQHTQLSAQLAAIEPNNVSLNNRLVGALNSIKGQHDLGQEQHERLQEQVKAARRTANEAREAYLQFIFDARKLADQAEAEYASKSADPAVKAALATWNQAAGKQLTLAPSTSFQASLRRLKQLEESVLTASIELRGEGRVVWVSTMVNGKQPVEMIVDSGASIVSLPHALAEKIGMRPTEKDPIVILQLADGSEIQGRQMTIRCELANSLSRTSFAPS